jgi:hypothetical protein
MVTKWLQFVVYYFAFPSSQIMKAFPEDRVV